MKKSLLLFFCFCSVYLNAQETHPVNGPHNQLPRYDVFIKATVVTDYQTILTNATLIIKDGKVEQVGTNIAIPKNALVHDMRGRWIYPAFIDLYSNYGVKNETEKKGQNRNNTFVSNKAGAYHWNEAIKAEIDAVNQFSPDPNKAEQLRAYGFGAVLSGTQDGIYRGTATLVHTGNQPEQQLIIKDKAATGLSFQKGSSTVDYPSSLMGAIALLRQTYLDAQWYKKQTTEKNLTMDAWISQQQLPQIFAAENKLNILRADRIGDEFGIQYIIKGGGDEYQRINEIKATAAPLIIPVNFPKPYDVSDPFDADLISTADLKHWEMAPANLAILTKNNIEYSITSQGCAQASQFWKNIRKAVKHGVDAKIILKALTHNPATFIRAEKQLGALKPGMSANLLISSNNVFDEDAMILEVWTNGYKHTVNKMETEELNGKYQLKLGSDGAAWLTVKKKSSKQEGTLTYLNDTFTVSIEQGEFLSMIAIPKRKTNSRIQFVAIIDEIDSNQFPYRILRFSGKVQYADGSSGILKGTWYENLKEEADKKDTVMQVSSGLVSLPFTDYGYLQTPAQETTLFKNATVWTNESEGILTETDVAIKDGKILAIGKGLKIPGAKEIDATGKHLTSGIIDEHSHIAISNGVNEGTQAITSEVRIGDVVNSEDVNIYRQLAGGVTAAQLLHGSANPIGGQSALIKLRWGFAPEKMKIEGADGFIKFALGENVKQSNWGDRATVRYPQTRMGVEQVLMDGFTRAKEYELKLKSQPDTRRDLELDALVEIIRKKRFITCHSYVQSEINMLMHVADSFGFKVNTFTHILEGYKVADKMKAHGVNASTFADWWAYKYEVVEAIPYNAAILHRMGVTTAINSDDAEMGRRLNQEAAKIVKYGKVPEEDAWKMVTLNPARMLHLDKQMGSIKPGKDADLVLWNNHPLSIAAKPVYTYVDGRCLFSIQQDEELRKQIKAERSRIIQKLMDAKNKGEKAEKHVSEEDPNYHCED